MRKLKLRRKNIFSKYCNIKRKISIIYYHQKSNSKKRGHPLPKYTKEEFLEYCLNSETFQTLYKEWVQNNCLCELSPSIDRINNNKGYSFNNIQVMTWRENRLKK